ncbi:SET domain-containing protein [Flavobacterium sp.]|uniref:SET domain-containing protein n=1 Tax=Flavobacterium sp. TaxID=239 RepID=UPI0037BF668F
MLVNGECAEKTIFVTAKIKSNISRFLNHSLKGNCSSIRRLYKNKPIIIIFSNRKIKKG